MKTTENWEAVAAKTVIDALSGQTVDSPDARTVRPRRTRSATPVCRKTEGKVLTIYFTDFVMQ